MGKAIEAVAEQRGHEIGVAIDDEDDWMNKLDDLRDCDIAVEFSTPATVVGNIMRCFDLDIPVVVGTTGWYEQLESVVHDCQQRGQSLFVASNFSIGMNMMFPSGTAITLADDIIEELDRKDEWQLKNADGKGRRIKKHAIPITSIREGEVPGIHEVVYDSDIDTITLRHSAKSRKGLALGAVLACEFMEGRKGYHTMRDLLA